MLVSREKKWFEINLTFANISMMAHNSLFLATHQIHFIVKIYRFQIVTVCWCICNYFMVINMCQRFHTSKFKGKATINKYIWQLLFLRSFPSLLLFQFQYYFFLLKYHFIVWIYCFPLEYLFYFVMLNVNGLKNSKHLDIF